MVQGLGVWGAMFTHPAAPRWHRGTPRPTRPGRRHPQRSATLGGARTCAPVS